MLAESGLAVTTAGDMADGARKVVALAAGKASALAEGGLRPTEPIAGGVEGKGGGPHPDPSTSKDGNGART